ncbi:MAG: tetratricopeptide repeat protein, partial [Nitrospinae bacterium]|nr:tetratricopeptide repeat protein [Nitrospinota bacterium]
MSNNISNELLLQLNGFISSSIGLHFPESRLNDLKRGIVSAAQEFGYTDIEAFIRWLMSSKLAKKDIEILSSHLTIGETYFFRDKKSFETLEGHILPQLISSRQDGERRLRIWSAGCSTGEEPYSIAILLKKLIRDVKDWNITILGTDINPNFLRKASEGIYTEWSFRNTPSWVKEGYFKNTKDGNYKIIPDVKKMAVFEYLNLAEDVYPSLLNNTNGIDIIFCHNVLMYFSHELSNRVVHSFYNSLVDKGWLSVGPTDFVKPLSSQWTIVNYNDAAIYRKDEIKTHEVKEFQPKDIPSFALPSVDIDKSLQLNKRQEKKIEEPERERQRADLKKDAMLIRDYANQGRLGDAIKWCERAIASDRLNPNYHYLFATILIEQGRVEDAVKSLKRTIYLDNNYVLAYFILGNLMFRSGELKTSKKYF